MKKYGLIILLQFLFVSIYAQSPHTTGRVTGILVDSATSKAIQFASVAVFDLKDSTIVNFGLSDRDGGFEMGRMPFDANLRLLVSHVIYGSHIFNFQVSAGSPTKDFDTLYIKENLNELAEAVVRWEQAPITLRNDTIEFNADAFKTREGSMVEDLLKKLPGVEVKNGEVTANGRKVSKITIDGQQFFGSDPTSVMKNLPSMIVEKVQITEEKDEYGESTGSGNAVINLTLKAGAKKGHFGKAFAGYGTDDRYEAGLLWNLFRDTTQLSIVGYSNNLSAPGFSMTDLTQLAGFDRSGQRYYSYSDGSYGINGLRMGGGKGITASSGGGFNFNHDIPKKLFLNLSYFAGYNDSRLFALSQKESFLGDTVLFTSQDENTRPVSQNHSIFGLLRWTPDTINTFEFHPEFNLTRETEHSFKSAKNKFDEVPDTSFVNNVLDNESNTFSYELRNSYRRRIKGKYDFSIYSNLEQWNRESFTTNLIEQGVGQVNHLYDQKQVRDDKSKGWSIYTGSRYNRELKKNWFTGLAINYEGGDKTNTVLTTRNDSGTSFIPVILADFSTEYREQLSSTALETWVSRKFGNWQLRLSATFNNQFLRTSTVTYNPSSLDRNYKFISPRLSASRSKGESYFSLSYGYNFQRPDSWSLIAASDNTNPAFIKKGNPNLQGYYSHNVRLFCNVKNKKTNISFYGSANLEVSQGNIVQNTDYLPSGIQEYTYINIDRQGTSMWGYGQLRRPFKLKNEWEIAPALSTWSSTHIGYTSINRIQYQRNSNYTEAGGSISLTKGEKLDTKITYSFSYQQSQTEILSPKRTITPRSDLQFDFWFAISQKWWMESKYTLVNVPQSSGSPAVRYNLWNLSITRLVLKNNAGQLRLSVFDLLHQNQQLERYTTANYVETSYENAVTRYYMLSFVYNLHQFKTTGRTKRGFEWW